MTRPNLFLRRLCTCALMASVSGCSLAPAYQRPAVPLPAQAATSPTEMSPSTPPADQWWRNFGSTELDGLIALSLAHNNDLQAAIARIDEARANARIASAPLLPTLGVSGSADASTRSNSGTNSNGGSRSSSSSGATLVGQASYEIDLFGRYRSGARSARALAEASAFDRDAVAISLAASVADTYFQLLSLMDRLRFSTQVAADARRVLGLIEARRSVGTATDLDIAQQRNVAATFEASAGTLRQQIAQTRHALALLVGDAPDGITVTTETMKGLDVPVIAPDMPAALLNRRPDIRAAEARLVAANFDIGSARAAFFPSITLTGQGGLESSSLARIVEPGGLASAAASLLAPIFDGGRLTGQLRYSQARQRELAATYRQTVLSAFRDVADALSAAERLQEIERADVEAEDAARKAAELSQAQFRLGTIDQLTLLDTQRTLYVAQDATLQARLQRFQAAIALNRALAGGYGGAGLATAQ